MELNAVLFAGIGAGVVVGYLLGFGSMCWLVMSGQEPIRTQENPDTHAQFPAWPPLPEELGCPPCNGNCNQGRTCPVRGR
jgi:hypothetical protein